MLKKIQNCRGSNIPELNPNAFLIYQTTKYSILINTSIPINQALQYSTMIKKIQNNGSIHTSCRVVVQRRRLLQSDYLQKANAAKQTLAKQ